MPQELRQATYGLLFAVLGFGVVLPALCMAAGVPEFDRVPKLSAPLSCAGPEVGVRLVAGCAVLAVLVKEDAFRISRPDLMRRLVRDDYGFAELDAHQYVSQTVEPPPIS